MKKSLMCLAVSIKYRRVTDGRTDVHRTVTKVLVYVAADAKNSLPSSQSLIHYDITGTILCKCLKIFLVFE